MTKFESLLIKTGNPDLIIEFIKEFPDKANNDDFRREVATFWRRAKVNVMNVLYAPEGLLDMKLSEFLNMYGGNNNRFANTLRRETMANKNGEIETVQDLLKYSKKELQDIRGVGEKRLSQLLETLEWANLELSD